MLGSIDIIAFIAGITAPALVQRLGQGQYAEAAVSIAGLCALWMIIVAGPFSFLFDYSGCIVWFTLGAAFGVTVLALKNSRQE